MRDGSLLMLVSIVLAPYGWLYDQCLVLPALLDAAYATRRSWLLIALSAMILVADMQLCMANLISPLWLWTAPAWWGWYVIARATRPKHEGN